MRYFTLKCCDLETRVSDPSKSLEMSPCDFLLTFHSKYGSISCRFLKYSMSKNVVTLKPELRVTQGHRNRHVSIRHL